MQKTKITAIFAGMALVAAVTLAPTNVMAQARWTFGTNPQGSIGYTVGSAIARVLDEETGHRVTVQPYAGSSVYLPLIVAGETTLGLNSSIDVGMYRSASVDGGADKLRTIARIWPVAYAFMVRAESGITDINDLKGKRVVTDMRGNTAIEAMNTAMLAHAGLTRQDVAGVTAGGIPQGVQDLIEGRVDATSVAVGIPLTRQAHATISGGVRYIDIGDTATDESLGALLPGLFTVVVEPSESRPGVTAPVRVSGFNFVLVGNSDMSDEDAAAIVKALHRRFEQLQADVPALRAGAADKLASPSNTAPYHPGAIAAFKKLGIWTEENELRESRF